MTSGATVPGRRRNTRGGIGVAIAVALVAAGAFSSIGGASVKSGVATAQQRVNAAKAVPTFKAPGPAFDASKAKGKTVYYIANSMTLQFTQVVHGGAANAFKAAGVKLITQDNQASASNTARLISEAIAQKANLIIIQSVPSNLITAPLEQAKKAGIPVIQLFETDPQLPPASEKNLGVVGQVTYCYSCAGKLLADYAIANSGGKANAMSIEDSDVGVSAPEINGIKSEFAALCPACKLNVQDVLVSEWATKIATITQTSLTNSSLNWMLPIYDGMTGFMLPAIHAASAQNRIKIATFNADLTPMQSMAKKDVIVADVGSPLDWMGWAIADQSLRVLSGVPTVANENVPLRMFDASNLGTINLSKPESTWYKTPYTADYMKLWGLK
jgi:ribose transport system substrate-binding protein